MAARPKVKFMAKKGGAVHVVTTKTWDNKHSKCPSVVKGHTGPGWRGKGLSPDAALALKGCSRCDTHSIAEQERVAALTPAQKRAEAKARRDATMDKLRTQSRTADRKRKRKEAVDKLKQRRGPKGGDPTERMKANVEEHARLAEEHGWTSKAWESGTKEWTCEATRNGETLKLIYRDGRTVWSRVVLASGVEVRLRNSSNWRKHATGEAKIKPDYAPRGAGGKKAARKQTISDDAPRRLPFNLEADDDDTIIESLAGKRITWRNGTSGMLEESVLPTRPRNIRITQHPKSGRSMVSFYELQGSRVIDGEREDMLGMERTVYLDKILKAI